MSKFLIENLDLQGHLSTVRGENRPKSRPFKAENNAQTFLNQFKGNSSFCVMYYTESCFFLNKITPGNRQSTKTKKNVNFEK